MPENWTTYKLEEISRNVSRRFDFSKWSEVVFINTGDVLEGKFLHSDLSPSKKLPGQAKKAIKRGDILFSEIRPKNKRFAYVDINCDNYVVSTKFMVIETDDSLVDRRFFLQILTSNERLSELQSIAEGRSGTFPQITFDAIGKIEFHLPPLQEQKSIASILSALDDKIELNLQMNKTLEDIAMALYQHWFVDFEPFQIGEFVDSELGEIPKGWEVKPIKDLLSIKPINGLYKEKKFQGKGNRWLKMKSVYGLPYIMDQEMELISVTAQEQEKYGCMFNDLVFGRTSLVLEGIGTCAIIKTTKDVPIFESNLFRLRVDPNLLDPNILYLFFKSKKGREEVKKIARQTAAVSITSRDLTEIKIPVPPAGSDYLNENIDNMFSQIMNNLMENSYLTQLRDNLLPKLISGEVRVKDAENTLSEVL